MPKSKHRRNGKVRPRAYQTTPPVKNPAPSPPWVPATGVGLLLAGVLVIVIGSLPAIADRIASWPPLGSNNDLVLGFILMLAGFGFLIRWR